MPSDDLSRRDFHRLASAALGGLLAGAVSGCGKGKQAEPDKPAGDAGAGDADDKVGSAANRPAKGEPHICRGLNLCKGGGADKMNDCAGQGSCATVAMHHHCGVENDCKGQGGCHGKAGRNNCKGKGGCGVPMRSSMWKKARKIYEEDLTALGKKFGEPPPEKPLGEK